MEEIKREKMSPKNRADFAPALKILEDILKTGAATGADIYEAHLREHHKESVFDYTSEGDCYLNIFITILFS